MRILSPFAEYYACTFSANEFCTSIYEVDVCLRGIQYIRGFHYDNADQSVNETAIRCGRYLSEMFGNFEINSNKYLLKNVL